MLELGNRMSAISFMYSRSVCQLVKCTQSSSCIIVRSLLFTSMHFFDVTFVVVLRSILLIIWHAFLVLCPT